MVQPWQLQEARNHQERKGGTLGRALVSLGFLEDEELTTLLSRQYGVPSINLDPLTVDPAILQLVPEEMARTYKVLPLSRSGATLTVAMADPTNVLAMEDIRLTAGCSVGPVVASESALENAIDLCYGPARAPACGGTPRSPRPARRASGQSGSTWPRCTRPRWGACAAPSAASSRTWRTCGCG